MTRSPEAAVHARWPSRRSCHKDRPCRMRLSGTAKAGAFEKFMTADNEFHAQLYKAADKHDIWALVKSRSGHIDRLRRLHLPSPGKAQDIVRKFARNIEAELRSQAG